MTKNKKMVSQAKKRINQTRKIVSSIRTWLPTVETMKSLKEILTRTNHIEEGLSSFKGQL